MKDLPKTTTEYILWSLIPYTEPNLKLVFKPTKFVYDIEKISKKNTQTIKNAYYKGIKDGLFLMDDQGVPRLTEKGRNKIRPYKPQKLKGSCLIVMFDIPEQYRNKRQHLRALLRELEFTQIQKSVWQTQYDCRNYIQTEIEQYNLSAYVLVYEASQIKT